jgi:parvulin-like peptidyl-prolyl isomerase
MKNIRLLALVLALLMLSACAVAEPTEDPVVIRAGEITMSLSEVQAVFDNLYAQYNEYYTANGYPMTEETVLQIRAEAVSIMGDYAVLDSKIQELGLDKITDEEREALRATSDAEFATTLTDYANYYGLTAEEAAAEAAAQGYTLESQFEAMLLDLPYQRLYDLYTGDITVDEADIDATYQGYVESDQATYGEDIASYEMYSQYYGAEILYVPEGYRLAKHILLMTPEETETRLMELAAELSALQTELDAFNSELSGLEAMAEEGAEATGTTRTAEAIQADIDAKQAEVDLKNAEHEAARAQIIPALQPKIDDINSRLAAGESFDALIAEYNEDPGMTANPDGYMVHKDSVVWDTDFRDGAMALAAIGDVSEPILTSFGVHIIQYASDAPSGPVPMTDAMRENIYQSLLSAAKDEAYLAVVENWRAETTVETFPELLVLPEVSAEEGLEEGEGDSVG